MTPRTELMMTIPHARRLEIMNAAAARTGFSAGALGTIAFDAELDLIRKKVPPHMMDGLVVGYVRRVAALARHQNRDLRDVAEENPVAALMDVDFLLELHDFEIARERVLTLIGWVLVALASVVAGSLMARGHELSGLVTAALALTTTRILQHMAPPPRKDDDD